MGYYFYYPLENKIFVARNAEFFENSLMVQEASESHGLLESSGNDEGLELIQEEDTQPSDITSDVHNEVVPIEVALSDLESDKWLEAMNTEIQSIKDNQVWVLVELPPNAHMVAKGYTQTYGVEYRETFSPVANIRAIRILLAIAAFYDYEQASRSWNKRFDVEIKKICFTQNPDEPCVYLKASRSNVAFLILYVDDILLIGNNVTMLQEVKSWLSVDSKSAKQSTTAMSSTEAEYIAAAEASIEAA
ncbi:retrotransposon protein, putative, ty1-copia subclass [Tanacetum coccineum]